MYSECFGQSTSIYKADERSALRQQMEIQLSELHPLHGRTLYMSLRCNVASHSQQPHGFVMHFGNRPRAVRAFDPVEPGPPLPGLRSRLFLSLVKP